MDLPVSLSLRWNQNQVLRQTVKQVTFLVHFPGTLVSLGPLTL